MKVYRTKFILLIFSLFILISCNSDDENSNDGRDFVGTTTLEFKHYRTTATALDNGLFPVVKRGEEGSDFGVFYGGLSGFQPELGFNYTIEVNEFFIDEPLADASSVEYDFVRLIEKVPGPTTEEFDLRLTIQFGDQQDSFLTMDGNGDFKLLDVIPIVCNSQCDELTQPLQDQDILVGTFTRNEDNSYVLLSTSIQ